MQFPTFQIRLPILFPTLFIFALLTSCSHQGAMRSDGENELTVLLINDIYRINGVDDGAAGGLARVATLRKKLEQKESDLLVLHAGDILFPSMLSRSYKGEQMIDVLNMLDGDETAFDDDFYVTFGNHEFDKSQRKDAPMLDQRIDESEFTWLSSNIRFRRGKGGNPVVSAKHLKPYELIERNGMQIGIFAVTTDVKIPAYVSSIKDPVETARKMTAKLRADGADLVIALTHLTMKEDINLLETLGNDGPDIVFGGHEHVKLTENVNGRYVFKADAEARSALVARIKVNPGAAPTVKFKYHELDWRVRADPVVQMRVDEWIEKHDQDFCSSKNLPTGCLEKPIGKTAVTLIGEELQIRSKETNLGDWVADQAISAYKADGAQIAFLNSGGLRLNQNLLPKSDITRQTLSELFAYPAPLHLIKINGAMLKRVIEHSITGWPGEGRWLQISGFAWRHGTQDGSVEDITLLTDEGPHLIQPDEVILAVVNNFLLDPALGNQDGYSMLSKSLIVSQPDAAPNLGDLVIDALKDAGSKGIAPKVEGRICSMPQEQGEPCLAIDASM